MKPAEHPSRQAPLCADCRYSVNLSAIGLDLACDHPSASVNLVSGRPNTRCVDIRHLDAASLACGSSGALFEPQPQLTVAQTASYQHADLSQAD